MVKVEFEVQKPDPEIKGVPDTSGTGTKSGSRSHFAQTPTSSTSSASTSQTVSKTLQEDARPRLAFLSLDTTTRFDLKVGEVSEVKEIEKAVAEKAEEEDKEEEPFKISGSAGLGD
jgi:hypothetical protein